MTPRSWEKWVAHYEGKGHRVLAPSWPGLEPEVEAIRQDPSPLKGLGVGEIAHHYECIVRDLDSPPIIIGHSFGGLIAQLLLDRGLGSAGVTLGTAPIKGILILPPSSLRSALPGLKNPFGANGLAPLSLKQFRYRFTNTYNEAESKEVYERYYIPGAARPLFQAAYANFNPNAVTKVHKHNDERAPLLLIAGHQDHISPPAVNKATQKIYKGSKSVTELKQYAGKTHWMAGQPGWEEIADHALEWATAHSAGRVAA
jgi:pimeloyl-ACP methyl ester carboxylesterase